MDAATAGSLAAGVGLGSGYGVVGNGGGYQESLDSSPRSRGGESWDEPFPSNAKLRFMCSYGGHIVPRPHDKSLCYLGGDTRIVVVERHTTLSEFSSRLSSLVRGRPFTLKYQLPSEDLDSLISVTTEEDFDNMIEEYDRVASSSSHGGSTGSNSTKSSNKPSRIRLFLFPVKVETAPSSIGSLLDDSKSETWFVDALNGAISVGGVLNRRLSGDSATSSVNCLLGLEDDINTFEPSMVFNAGGVTSVEQSVGNHKHQIQLPRPDSSGKLPKHVQEVQSVPESPMRDTSTSFGSASSAPLLSDLPPIRVRPEDRSPDKRGFNEGGLEEHLSQMNITAVASVGQKQEEGFTGDGGFVAVHQQQHCATTASVGSGRNPVPVNPVPIFVATSIAPVVAPVENPSHDGRYFLSDDDEKSDHLGIKKPQQPPLYHQPNPDGSFDAAISERLANQPERIYAAAGTNWNTVTDPKQEVPSSLSDLSYSMQVRDQRYTFPVQPEQFQQHQQLYTPHLLQHNPSNPNSQLIPHPSTPLIPIQSFYQMNHQMHPQQQLPQNLPYGSQVPVYFVSVPQNPAYTVSMQKQNLLDGMTLASSVKPTVSGSDPTLPPHSAPQRSEPMSVATSNIYRTNAAASAVSQASPSPQFIHMSDQTQQFIPSYHPMHHHSSQSVASAAYTYDFPNQVQTQPAFYTQAASTPLPSHYQTMSSTAAIMSDTKTQLQQPDFRLP